MRELLGVIQKDNRTRLTIVTGRPASEINPMLSLPEPVEVWGLHGAERLYADGRHDKGRKPAAWPIAHRLACSRAGRAHNG